MSDDSVKFDLIQRTTEFGIDSIRLSKSIRKNVITLPLINQFIRSATSIGANYHEADDAESRNDFRHKIGICKKEARETIYWLKTLSETSPEFLEECSRLSIEAKELNLIFNAIIRKLDSKPNN